jgi:hypothetical protein
MWATTQQSVDNTVLFTAARTTQVQDVVVRSQGCVGRTQPSYGFGVVHPQSTSLITVINSLYKHPQITMNNIVQGAW